MNRNKQDKQLVIFIDSGDTIIDESTEIRNEEGIVIHADTIPGAAETLRTLYESGYTIALVADGELQSFRNVYEENGLGNFSKPGPFLKLLVCKNRRPLCLKMR